MKKLFTLLTLLVAIVTGAQGADTYYYGCMNLTNGALTPGNTSITQFVKGGTTLTASTDISISSTPGTGSCYYNSSSLAAADLETSSNWGTGSSSSRTIRGLKFASGTDYTLALGTKTATSITFYGWCGSSSKKLTIGGVEYSTPSTKNTFFAKEFTKSDNFTGNVTISQTGDCYGILVIVTGDSAPSDTRTNLVGVWTNDAPTFEYGEAATAPTFSVTPNTATPGTAYSVAYSLVSGSNVTVDATNGITAIDTNTPGESVVKATITVIDGDNYKATTTEYETTITVNPEQVPSSDFFSADVIVSSNQSFAAGTVEVTSTQATISGGKVYAINGQSEAKNLIAPQNSIGYFCMTNNNTIFKIVLDQPLAAGDVITANGFGGEKNGVAKGLWVTSTSDRPSSAPACSGTSTTASLLQPILNYTVTASDEYVGKTELYIHRSAGASTYFDEFKISRPAPSSDPVITADATASITATESGVAATKEIAVEGANLTGTTLTATLNPAVTGLSVQLASDAISEGSITTTATLSYTATENAHGTTTLTFSDGTTTKDVTITYNAHVADYVQKTVSAATTWDFSKCASSNIELVGEQNRTDVLIANVTGYTLNSDFDAESMIINGDRLVYNGNCSQILKLKFKTSVPGTVQVTFSNTGGSRPYRYVKVNNTMSSEGSGDGTANDKTSEAILVAAGDVEITGYIPDATDPQERDGDVVGPSFLRVYKVIFTPLADDVVVLDDQNDNNATTIENNTGSDKTVTVIRNLSPDYYNTLFLPFALTTEQISTIFGVGTKVAKYKGLKSNGTTFLFENVTTDMEANVGYLVKPANTVNGFSVEGATIVKAGNISVTGGSYAMLGTYDTFTNGSSTGGGIGISFGGSSSSSSSNEIYYFTTDGKMKKLSANGKIKGLRAVIAKVPEGKTTINAIANNADLSYGGGSTETGRAREEYFVEFVDDASVVTAIEAIDNSQLTIDNDAPAYNLAGQKVGKGYKGIVIINGKKVVK